MAVWYNGYRKRITAIAVAVAFPDKYQAKEPSTIVGGSVYFLSEYINVLNAMSIMVYCIKLSNVTICVLLSGNAYPPNGDPIAL